jgi:hypothetical protein
VGLVARSNFVLVASTHAVTLLGFVDPGTAFVVQDVSQSLETVASQYLPQTQNQKFPAKTWTLMGFPSSAGHEPLVNKSVVVLIPAVVIKDFAEPAMSFVAFKTVRICLDFVTRLKRYYSTQKLETKTKTLMGFPSSVGHKPLVIKFVLTAVMLTGFVDSATPFVLFQYVRLSLADFVGQFEMYRLWRVISLPELNFLNISHFHETICIDCSSSNCIFCFTPKFQQKRS